MIQDQWEATKAKDMSWPDRFLHPSFLGWSDENPTPRDKSSTTRWQTYDSANSTTIEQELSPVGIVVVGSTAVAHYYFSTATENSKGERETNHGRYTDILVKADGGWQFIAWHGGERVDNEGTVRRPHNFSLEQTARDVIEGAAAQFGCYADLTETSFRGVVQ